MQLKMWIEKKVCSTLLTMILFLYSTCGFRVHFVNYDRRVTSITVISSTNKSFIFMLLREEGWPQGVTRWHVFLTREIQQTITTEFISWRRCFTQFSASEAEIVRSVASIETERKRGHLNRFCCYFQAFQRSAFHWYWRQLYDDKCIPIFGLCSYRLCTEC